MITSSQNGSQERIAERLEKRLGGKWEAFLHDYPGEPLLRVRRNSHTIVFVRLSPSEADLARNSEKGRWIVAVSECVRLEILSSDDGRMVLTEDLTPRKEMS